MGKAKKHKSLLSLKLLGLSVLGLSVLGGITLIKLSPTLNFLPKFFIQIFNVTENNNVVSVTSSNEIDKERLQKDKIFYDSKKQPNQKPFESLSRIEISELEKSMPSYVGPQTESLKFTIIFSIEKSSGGK